jgi:hypothetical protein
MDQPGEFLKKAGLKNFDFILRENLARHCTMLAEVR